MDLELHKVGASGRVALGGLLAGVEYVKAEQGDDGTVILSPVKIVAPTSRRASAPAADADDDSPWDDDTDDE